MVMLSACDHKEPQSTSPNIGLLSVPQFITQRRLLHSSDQSLDIIQFLLAVLRPIVL
jgi:hypothetical protein